MTCASLTGCANDLSELKRNATAVGVAQAKVRIDPLPAECEQRTPHAALDTKTDLLFILDKERSQLDKSNDSKLRCSQFHNEQAVQLAK